MAARTFREKKKSSFPLNFNVYINLDNRERARTKDCTKLYSGGESVLHVQSSFFANKKQKCTARAKFVFC